MSSKPSKKAKIASVPAESSAASSASTSSRKSYQSLDQRSHVLHRPDMYIGTVKNVQCEFYGATTIIQPTEVEETESVSQTVCASASSSSETGNNQTYIIDKQSGEINHGLHRIYVEILSNAIDNVWRSAGKAVKATKIKIDITPEGRITILNDGDTIPVEIHPESGLYNPDLIFGKLLTSSNYDDNEERMTSGRNGLGGKVTNVFSREFSVKLFDPESGYQYEQTWTDNMASKTQPKLTRPKLKNGFTEVTFLPDYARFGVDGLSGDMHKLFLKNVIDTAMITGVNVFFNGEKIPVKTMKDYALLYRPVQEREEMKKEVVVVDTPDSCMVITSQPRSEFSHISFVNGIETYHGGVHVDAWAEAILRPVLERINAKVKKGGTPLTMKDVRPYFRMFLNCRLVNPTFTSQEKSQLGSPMVMDPSKFIEQKHINAVMKWSVIEDISDLLKTRELMAIKKTEKKRGFVKIPGLDSANLAGGKNFADCSLILCEGDSAKTFAVKGIQTGVGGRKGRDYFGIFPLRGKLLNVRNSNVASITKNTEICNVIRALNLRYDVDYTDDEVFSTLSYGRIIILTDSDVDGYHICGLLINFFHKLFPTLLKRDPSFITCMRTPIVRLYMGKTDLPFYTLDDYHKWQHANPTKRGDLKYFKGLGTNNNREIETSFGKKMIEFVADPQTDLKMDQVFHTSFSDYRKKWLSDYKPSEERELVSKDPVQHLPISEFMDYEMIKFSIDNCKRSIANVMDGLKESQRKILYATFLKNLRFTGKTMKVAQLSGFVAERTNYHHGEQCLFETITKMAHDFVGSNNIPLLYRDGQFGTRILGGKDAANARYIFTKLDALTRLIYRPEDDVLLEYIVDEGEKVEPEFYVPILPMVLVNGSKGIGTGWSSEVPCYNPVDLVEWIRVWIANQEMNNEEEAKYPELHPWYRGFTGEIVQTSKNKYLSKGILTSSQGRTGIVRVVVSELPIGVWTDTFKDDLDTLLEERKIKSVKNNSTDVAVHLEIEEFKDEDAMKCNLETLGLTQAIPLTNMVLFSSERQVKKYESIEEILQEFCKIRHLFYVQRKTATLKEWSEQLRILENKMRFLKEVMSGDLDIKNVEEAALLQKMRSAGYYESSSSTDENDTSLGGYRYLLGMNIRSFTKQRLEDLAAEIRSLTSRVTKLEGTSPSQLWLDDLLEFEMAYQKF